MNLFRTRLLGRTLSRVADRGDGYALAAIVRRPLPESQRAIVRRVCVTCRGPLDRLGAHPLLALGGPMTDRRERPIWRLIWRRAAPALVRVNAALSASRIGTQCKRGN